MTVMSNEQENLNELLSSFYNEQESNDFKNDLNSLDQMLTDAPEPSAQTIDGIKNAVAEKLSSRRQRNRFLTIRRITVAAIVLVVALVGTNMDLRHDTYPDASGIALADLFDESDSSQIALLTAQVEEIEDALLSVRLDEYDTYSSDSYSELETELNEINGDFWKG
jgi:hypothetical protein